MNQDKLFIIIPTTPERRERVKETLQSIEDNSKNVNYEVIVYENEDGGWVPAVHNALDKNNIKDDDLVWLLGSDCVLEEGCTQILLDTFQRNFPDGEGIVEPWDVFGDGRLSQHPLTKAKYIRKYLDKRFTHWYSDNWFTEQALDDHKLVFANLARIDHKHFLNGKADKDKTYEKIFDQNTIKKDKELYDQLQFERGKKNADRADKPSIMIGLPTMHSMHPILAINIMKWMATGIQTKEYDLSIYPTFNVQPVDNARNEIVKNFLKSGCTHLWFIDSDTIPPPDALKRLLAHDKPIISALTPIIEHDETKNGYWRKWNCVGEDDKHLMPNTGTKMCKGCGSSCIMIKREVFDKMKPPYYRFTYQDDTGKEVMVSEDIYFIINALSLGIKTYADTSILCKHYKHALW